MTRAKSKKKKEFLSQREIEGLQGDKREAEGTLKEVQEYSGAKQSVDQEKIKKEINRLDVVIHEGSPGRIRTTEKDKLVKAEKELEAAIGAGMPTWYEMHQPTKNPGAVRKHMAWTNRNKENIKRYKQIQRTLRPMEPKSIEVLRKEK